MIIFFHISYKGLSTKDFGSRRVGCPVRTFSGQGGRGSSDATVRTLVKKSDFSKFKVYPHGQGD